MQRLTYCPIPLRFLIVFPTVPFQANYIFIYLFISINISIEYILMETIDIFIGAQAGSERVRNKNTRILGGKPLISHTLDTALNIKNIQNIVVSSNDPAVKEIVSDYKDIIYIDRPNEISTSISQDIEWILHVFETVNQDIFIKLPPTSPFRKVDFIEKSVEEFTNGEKYDSARAVALCKEHPGKMWVIDSEISSLGN